MDNDLISVEKINLLNDFVVEVTVRFQNYTVKVKRKVINKVDLKSYSA